MINKKRARALAWAIVLTARARAAQMAQPAGGGGGGGSMMGGSTSQYGVLEIIGIVIGVAVVILLVVLVVRVSKK